MSANPGDSTRRMQLRTFAVALLILQCWMPLTLGEDQLTNIGNLASVGTVNFKGSTLRVFEVDGAQVAEPRISFGDACDPIKYNYIYLKYQLTVPVQIDVNTLETPTDSSRKVASVTLSRLQVKTDLALASKDSKVTVIARVTKSDKGEAQLIFLCDTFIRCQQLKDDVSSNPEEFRLAVKLIPVGRVGNTPAKLGAFLSANPPKFNCNPGQWVVFQRRVDGSLSFAQNWDAYVNGFGNRESNYWMGLNKLFTMTVTGKQNGYPLTSRCELRVETEDFQGKNYWGEYKLFEVLGPDVNYRLRLGQEVAGSQLTNFVSVHNEQQFSTYDSDHDAHGSDSCSQLFGYGGWWYAGCHSVNLNGAYTTDKSIDNNPTYVSIVTGGRHLPMKTTLMKFRCY